MSRRATIGAFIIALRKARAGWLTSTHKHVITMLVSRLPTIRPTQDQIGKDTGFDRRTVRRVLADLRAYGIVAFDGGKKGRAHVYVLSLDALQALAPKPRRDGIVRPTSEMGSTIPSSGSSALPDGIVRPPKSHSEEASEETTPQAPHARPSASAPPARSAAGAGKGEPQPPTPDPDPVRRILVAYASGYLRARKVDPTINGVANRDAAALLAAVGIDGALLRIEHASRDPWWAAHGTLGDIARRPDRWATPPPAPRPVAAATRLQPMSGRSVG